MLQNCIESEKHEYRKAQVVIQSGVHGLGFWWPLMSIVSNNTSLLIVAGIVVGKNSKNSSNIR